MPEAHDRKSKKIRARSWKDLCERWPDHIPNIRAAGEPPEDVLAKLPDLQSELAKIPADQLVEVSDNIPGVRAGVLHESIYLLHKAVHVLGSSLVHVSNGMCTWSLSSAYHSAFFAVKAISGLLGVSIIEFQNKTFLVDVWGSPKKPRKKWPIILLVRMDRAEQRHVWGTFQRLLDKTDGVDATCPAWLRTVLVQSDFRDFGRQRNGLHYHNNVWYLADLHNCVHQGGFASSRVAEISLSQQDFSIHLACGLVRMGELLLGELGEASSSHILRLESALIARWLDEPFNAAYRRLIPGPAAHREPPTQINVTTLPTGKTPGTRL